MDTPHHFIGCGRDKLERDFTAGFRRRYSPDRFRENRRREKITGQFGVGSSEFGDLNFLWTKNSGLRTNYSELVLRCLGNLTVKVDPLPTSLSIWISP